MLPIIEAMRNLALSVAALSTLALSGCSFEDVAANAADAAACTALSSTLNGLSEAYQQGLVDSGVLAQVDDLVGDQLDSLLSSELAADLKGLTSALAETETASGAQAQVDEFLGSITDRCAAVGINLN